MGIRWWQPWKTQPPARPEGAHFLSADGVWMSSWRCPHGMPALSTPDEAPVFPPDCCMECWESRDAIKWTRSDGKAIREHLRRIGSAQA